MFTEKQLIRTILVVIVLYVIGFSCAIHQTKAKANRALARMGCSTRW